MDQLPTLRRNDRVRIMQTDDMAALGLANLCGRVRGVETRGRTVYAFLEMDAGKARIAVPTHSLQGPLTEQSSRKPTAPVEVLLQRVAHDIDSKMPDGSAFVVLVQADKHGGDRETHYISNGPRDGIATMLREMVLRFDGRIGDPIPN